ncbi:MAG: hypothetical protein M1825_003759 [Sarcosagium campestre]|nr:MAG: hypothetical protein M1825_003759 [Sarcosagium campestre]
MADKDSSATAQKASSLLDVTNILNAAHANAGKEGTAENKSGLEGESSPKEATADKVETGTATDGQKKIRKAPDGWTKPKPFNYAIYNAETREEREAVEALAPAEDVGAWAATATKYEWKDEYGDVGPSVPALEKQLFGGEHAMRRGIEFEKISSIEVRQEGETRIKPILNFEDAGLHPVMLENIKLCKYETCTPVQAYCIPAVLLNKDIIACAQTGSGKTAAFLIPTLSKLMGKAKKVAAARPNPVTYNPATDAVRAEPLVVVVAPTRELATQIFDEARRFCYRSMLRPCVVYGGAPTREQREELQKGCDVLIATPGRLCDFMDKPNVLSLRRVKYTIIDEADEMLNADWEADLSKIMSGGDTNNDVDHIFMMFSATFPKGARALAKEYMADDHVRIRVGRSGSTHANIVQQMIWVDEENKIDALFDLLQSLPPNRTIVFVNSKHHADFVDDELYNADYPSTSIHADRTQREREDALRAFRSGTCPILVATGVSARGLDVDKVMHVVNYDLPSGVHGGIDEYIHRIGRTARIGNTGVASSFYNRRNEDIVEDLVKVLLETGQVIPDFLSEFAKNVTQEGTADGIAALNFDDDTDTEEQPTVADATASTSAEGGNSSSAWGTAPVVEAGAWGNDEAEKPASSGAWGNGQDSKNEKATSVGASGSGEGGKGKAIARPEEDAIEDAW